MSNLSITLTLNILYHNCLQVKGWPRDTPKKPNENIMHPFSTDGEKAQSRTASEQFVYKCDT